MDQYVFYSVVLYISPVFEDEMNNFVYSFVFFSTPDYVL